MFVILTLQVDEQLIREIKEQVTKATKRDLIVKVNGGCTMAGTISSGLLCSHFVLNHPIDKLGT